MNLSHKIPLHHYRYTITDYFIITIWITKAFSFIAIHDKKNNKDNSKSQESLLILPLLPQKF
ncbi:hypothetical protein [Helicobacter pullorum]|uniref:hypothetical protein n=1 Tax=Helicobacter pullorum TaxID=35818 RepID=UPI00081694B9|nr:hypothetical protein [Helicobacter pullorum]OCR14463.1 hypothetical protein BA915_07180 [Helicobacter pullorum]